jgi:hypothetical protein
MKASEFLKEDVSAAFDLVHTAKKYLTQMFAIGTADRAAVMSTIDVLHTRGADYKTAAFAVKKAFTDLKGSDVTTEAVFEGLFD